MKLPASDVPVGGAADEDADGCPGDHVAERRVGESGWDGAVADHRLRAVFHPDAGVAVLIIQRTVGVEADRVSGDDVPDSCIPDVDRVGAEGIQRVSDSVLAADRVVVRAARDDDAVLGVRRAGAVGAQPDPVAGDGVPGASGAGDQDFGLAALGGVSADDDPPGCAPASDVVVGARVDLDPAVVVAVEGGTAWIPTDVGRLERIAAEPRRAAVEHDAAARKAHDRESFDRRATTLDDQALAGAGLRGALAAVDDDVGRIDARLCQAVDDHRRGDRRQGRRESDPLDARAHYREVDLRPRGIVRVEDRLAERPAPASFVFVTVNVPANACGTRTTPTMATTATASKRAARRGPRTAAGLRTPIPPLR